MRNESFSTRLLFFVMFLAAVFGMAALSDCIAQDSKSDKQASKKQRIRVPESKIVVTPLPGAVIVLKTGEWCILEHDSEFFVRPHPAGIVEVDKKIYPKGLTVMGTFAGGGGKIETRDFNGPYLAFIKPIAKGSVEIDSIPIGVMDEADIVTLSLSVNQLPQPPPDDKKKDDVPPDVIPQPKPVVVTYPDAGFVILEDLDRRTPADALTFDFRQWDKLPIDGRYRLYSVKSPDAIRLGYVKLYESTGKKLPIILAVKPDGSLIESKEQPSAFSDAEAFVKKITGK